RDAHLPEYRVRLLQAAAEVTREVHEQHGEGLRVLRGEPRDVRVWEDQRAQRRLGPHRRGASHDPDERHFAEAGPGRELRDPDLSAVRPALEYPRPPLLNHEELPPRSTLLDDYRAPRIGPLVEQPADNGQLRVGKA